MNFSHIPILSIDGGTNCGYAFWDPELKRVFHGSWNLSKHREYGHRYLNYLKYINEIVSERGFEKDLRLLSIIEAPAYGTMKGAQAELGPAWVSQLKMWCASRKLIEPKVVASNSWRSYFIDYNKKPKAFTGPEATTWYKEQVMMKCNALGITPKDNDAADAIGLLKWFKDGCIVESDRRRDLRNREKANKRAQAKFTFEKAEGVNA